MVRSRTRISAWLSKSVQCTSDVGSPFAPPCRARACLNARIARPWPGRGPSGDGWRDRYGALRRGCITRQMLRDQFLGFGETVQFNLLIAADSVRGIGNHDRQGVIAVVEMRQHLRARLSLPC